MNKSADHQESVMVFKGLAAKITIFDRNPSPGSADTSGIFDPTASSRKGNTVFAKAFKFIRLIQKRAPSQFAGGGNYYTVEENTSREIHGQLGTPYQYYFTEDSDIDPEGWHQSHVQVFKNLNDAFSEFYPQGSLRLNTVVHPDSSHFPRMDILLEGIATISAAYAHSQPVLPLGARDSAINRAENLLADLASTPMACMPDSRVTELSQLADENKLVRDLLLQCIQKNSPRVQGIILDIMAVHDWPAVSGFLTTAIARWNEKEERHLLLGALRLMRRHKVTPVQAAALNERLRVFLSNVASGARKGEAPDLTELLVEALAALGSFAQARDLVLASAFWQSDCAFEVAREAERAGARIAARLAPSMEVEAFFASASVGLCGRLIELFNVRHLAPNNGAIFWLHAGLLLSRLGPETECVRDFVSKYPATAPRLRRMSEEAEGHLARIGHEAWLDQQRPIIDLLKAEFAKAIVIATLQ